MIIWKIYIGQQFEKRQLLIYNGLMFGLSENEGMNVISISSNEKYINLIQCEELV